MSDSDILRRASINAVKEQAHAVENKWLTGGKNAALKALGTSIATVAAFQALEYFASSSCGLWSKVGRTPLPAHIHTRFPRCPHTGVPLLQYTPALTTSAMKCPLVCPVQCGECRSISIAINSGSSDGLYQGPTLAFDGDQNYTYGQACSVFPRIIQVGEGKQLGRRAVSACLPRRSPALR